jgi:DNA-binding response OmpR family regulator
MERDGQNPTCEALRVLVVEDDRDTAETLRTLLGLCGYYVVVAHTSQQGIEAARKLEPHIVLCDIGLPDSDGYVVGSVLR